MCCQVNSFRYPATIGQLEGPWKGRGGFLEGVWCHEELVAREGFSDFLDENLLKFQMIPSSWRA